MGGGRWDDDVYTSATKSRVASKTPDFDYTTTATKVHDSLNPERINGKPFGKLESRDSTDHPESNAIMVCFDVTGSNISRAREAQKKLPNLMNLLGKYVSDPQICFAANDDFHVQGNNSIQIADFESDNRVDEHLRNIWLVGDGGGNSGESYDLLMYAAARKTVLDCFEKRGKKGYFFMYADEPIFDRVEASQVRQIFGDNLQKDIPIAEIIEELQRTYNTFVIWPQGGYDDAYKQQVKLFGEESVVILQHPNLICELIGSIIGLHEGTVASTDGVVKDLVSVGTSDADAKNVATALATYAGHHDLTQAGKKLRSSGKGKAARI